MEEQPQNPTKTLRTLRTTQRQRLKTYDSKKMKNYRGAVAASKSTGHGRASRLVYIALDSPRKRTGDVNLQAPRPSYSSR